jgi:predicted TIM-barrel enzyme
MQRLFQGRPPLIGMIHLGELPGQEGFTSQEALESRALEDLRALEGGGIDAVLVENWKDESPGPTVSAEAEAAIRAVTRSVTLAASVPVGLNVLPNDHRAALSIARACGAAFVQLDVFVDPVRSSPRPRGGHGVPPQARG